MKILYLTNNICALGGIERILLLKANYFIKNFNYDITILTQKTFENCFFSSCSTEKIIIKSINLKITQNLILRQIQRGLYFLELKKYLKNEKYDIIITTGSLADPFLPYFTKIYTIKEIHISKQIKKGLGIKDLIYRTLENFWLKKYTKIIILTDEDKKNWNLSNIEVIHNPLIFCPKNFSKCENKKIISVGRLDIQKGYDILIDVWSIVSKNYPDWILEIYGEGSERENLQNKINKLGLEKSFLLKGAVQNIQDKYLESSIYVMSSRYEGMPLVLLEAMAYGLPVVSFDCPCGPKDIIKDNEDGFLVKFGNIEEMAEKIEELITDENKRKLFGKNARINIQRFSQDKIMNQWKELFENLMVEKNVK